LSEAGHVTTNPCCGFMEEEAKELSQEFSRYDSTGNATESSTDGALDAINELSLEDQENTAASANNV
jgi:hypothetical protein